MCYFSLWALEETVLRKLLSSPFQNWEDEFKTLIFEKREFNFTQVCNVKFSFFLILLCFLTLKLELMN